MQKKVGLLSTNVWFNGKEISLIFEFLERKEAEFLFEEIFVRDEYIQHGVKLPFPSAQVQIPASRPTIPPDAKRRKVEPAPQKSLVLDIGANIGLFALRASYSVGPNTVIVACEPVPPIFDVLRRNVAGRDNIVPLRCAVGGKSSTCCKLTYYPDMPGESTRYPAERDRQFALVQSFKSAMTSVGSAAVTECEYEANSVAASETVSRSSAKTISTVTEYHTVPDTEVTAVTPKCANAVILSSKPACMPLTSRTVDLSTAFAPAVTFTSVCKTVSEIADAFRATCITLLKVDVEGDELEVLQGIRNDLWSSIQQVVLEVHDVYGRLEAIKRVLKAQGFRVHVRQQQTSVVDGYCMFVPDELRMFYVHATRHSPVMQSPQSPGAYPKLHAEPGAGANLNH